MVFVCVLCVSVVPDLKGKRGSTSRAAGAVSKNCFLIQGSTCKPF